jgi:multiple sugar transport system permease protein
MVNVRFRKKKRPLLPYFFLAPALVILIAFVVYPLVFSLRISFTNYSFGKADSEIVFVAFKNFVELFKDSYFINGLKNTVIFMFVTGFSALFFGLCISLLLQKSFWGSKFVLGMLILPMATTPIVVGVIWRLVLMPDYSIVNYLLRLVGIAGPQWLLSPFWAFFSVSLAYVWEWTPFFVFMLSAGLATLPIEPYEAARIDGANWLQIQRFITIPQLKQIIFLILIIRMMDAFRVFDVVYSLTKGGPGRFTQLLSYVVYNTGIVYMDLGYASAMSYVMLIMLVLFTTFSIRLVRTRARDKG